MITIAFLCMSANLTDTPTTLTTTTTKIIAGYQHSVILHKENVWFMGKRQSYDNKTRILKRPTLIQNIDKITDISTSNARCEPTCPRVAACTGRESWILGPMSVMVWQHMSIFGRTHSAGDKGDVGGALHVFVWEQAWGNR